MPDLLSTYRPALGGSEPDALIEQIATARRQVWEAACKVASIDIHMRDYQGREADYYAELSCRARLVETLHTVANALYESALCVRQHID